MKKIVVCGSMNFAKEMLGVKAELTRNGFEAILPTDTEFLSQDEKLCSRMEKASRKVAINAICKHYHKIEKSNGILVLNYDKNGIANYIGANTFLEMGFAHVLNKPIFVLNPLPDMDYLKDELESFSPVILEGDLSKISFID